MRLGGSRVKQRIVRPSVNRLKTIRYRFVVVRKPHRKRNRTIANSFRFDDLSLTRGRLARQECGLLCSASKLALSRKLRWVAQDSIKIQDWLTPKGIEKSDVIRRRTGKKKP